MNIALIGMPGSGKSTFGKKLAVHQGMEFVDSDQIIEQQHGSDLETVVARRGLRVMREIEEQTICELNFANTVIATGGSVVYSNAGMQHLHSLSFIVYLRINLPTLLLRVSKNIERGLFKLPATTLQHLYFERKPLYEHWAQVSVDNNRPLTALQFSKLISELEGELTR